MGLIKPHSLEIESWGKLARGDVVKIANPRGTPKSLKLFGVWRFMSVRLDDNGDAQWVTVYPCNKRNATRSGVRSIDPMRVRRAPKSQQDGDA
jgi:hypothetical protein